MRRCQLALIGCMTLLNLQPLLAQAPAGLDPDAATLVREAKAAQDWLTKVKTFHVRFEDGLELAFDDKRLYLAIGEPGGPVRTRAWDGSRLTENLRDNYYVITDSIANFAPSFMNNLIWGRNGQRYWWDQPRTRTSDFVGDVSSYKLAGREKYHDVDCYVLQGGATQRIFIGQADHLLYGIRQGVTAQDFIFLDYKEVSPGRFYPMKQLLGTREHRAVEVVVDLPLPAALFQQQIKEGARVHETFADGTVMDYLYRADRPAEELAEFRADAARRKRYGPPPLPSGPVRLSSPAEQQPVNPLAVNPAADFPAGAKWINGGPIKLADLRGKVVLVVFWASWHDFAEGLWGTTQAPPNLKSLAGVEQDVVVVGVHVPTTDAAKVEKAAKDLGFTFPICIDVVLDKPDAGWGTMADGYRLDALSTTYVIDTSGKVAALGSWNEAVRRANELLGRPTTPAQTPREAGRGGL